MDTRIPIAKPYNSGTVEDKVVSILRSGRHVSGPTVEAFEEALSKLIGCEHVVAVNSGTAALHLALLAVGVKKNTQVITTPFSFAASTNAILYIDAAPKYADIEENTANIDPAKIASQITTETRAIEPVHLYGQPCRLDEIYKLARERGISVVEDAAQALGAEYKGRRIGSFGDVACFSTYVSKNLHTGEGGFIATNDDDIAEKLRIMRNQGQKGKYNHIMLGYNYRMTEIEAAIGLGQVEKIEELTRRRIENAQYLTRKVQKIDAFIPPYRDPDVRHVYHQYTIRVRPEKLTITRDRVIKELRDKGVEADVHYPKLIPEQPYLQGSPLVVRGKYPVAEKICRVVMSIPVHPALSREEIDTVTASLEDIATRYAA